ncbi:hypothetical protein N3K66_002064 [Trichothecium roseum]|uniref:Uncharacterized protein n=1 Tax=Trichothecium roseum TaxID=47278 RepID=A0ACC0V8I0_9HYPO|nr:hypothetical protein N3K66_002064 [Trichothecium roseum]
MDSEDDIMANVVNILGLNGATGYEAVAKMRRDTLENKLRANQNRLHKWSAASIYGIWLTYHVVGHSKDKDGDMAAFASYMHHLGFEWPAVELLWADCKELVVDGQEQGAEGAADAAGADIIARMDQAAEHIRLFFGLMPKHKRGKTGSAPSSLASSRALSMASSIVSSANRSGQSGPLQMARHDSEASNSEASVVSSDDQLEPTPNLTFSTSELLNSMGASNESAPQPPHNDTAPQEQEQEQNTHPLPSEPEPDANQQNVSLVSPGSEDELPSKPSTPQKNPAKKQKKMPAEASTDESTPEQTGGAFVSSNRAPQFLPAQAGNAPFGFENPNLPPIGGPYGPPRIPAHGSASIGQVWEEGSEAQLKAAAAESAQKSIREAQKPDVCGGCGNKGHHIINCPLGRGGVGAPSGQYGQFANQSSSNFGWGRMPSQTSGGFQNTEPRYGGLTPQIENMNLHHHVEEGRQAGYNPYATGAQPKNTAGGVPAGYNTFAQGAQPTTTGGGASASQNTQNTQKAPVAYMTADEFLEDLGNEIMEAYGGVLPPQKGTPEYQSAKRTKVTRTAPGDTTKVGKSDGTKSKSQVSTVMPKKSEDIVLGETLKSLDRDPPYSDAVHAMFKNKKNVWVHHSKRPTALDLWHKKEETEDTPVTPTVPGETSGQAGNSHSAMGNPNDGDGQSEGSASMEEGDIYDSPSAGTNPFGYTK